MFSQQFCAVRSWQQGHLYNAIKYRQPSLRAEPTDAEVDCSEQGGSERLGLTRSSPESAWGDLHPAVSASHRHLWITHRCCTGLLFPSAQAVSDLNPGPTYSHNEQSRLIHNTENINCFQPIVLNQPGPHGELQASQSNAGRSSQNNNEWILWFSREMCIIARI